MSKQISISPDGSVNINLSAIRKITIDNITDLLSHRLLRTDSTVRHVMEFKQDGRCDLAYAADGTLIEFRVERMRTSITPDNDIILRIRDDSKAVG